MQKECNDYVKMWQVRCYQNGLPDDVPAEIFDKAPSYRLIARAILSNDVELLGVIKRPCKAYIALKRKEIRARDGRPSQLSIFD